MCVHLSAWMAVRVAGDRALGRCRVQRGAIASVPGRDLRRLRFGVGWSRLGPRRSFAYDAGPRSLTPYVHPRTWHPRPDNPEPPTPNLAILRKKEKIPQSSPAHRSRRSLHSVCQSPPGVLRLRGLVGTGGGRAGTDVLAVWG